MRAERLRKAGDKCTTNVIYSSLFILLYFIICYYNLLYFIILYYIYIFILFYFIYYAYLIYFPIAHRGRFRLSSAVNASALDNATQPRDHVIHLYVYSIHLSHCRSLCHDFSSFLFLFLSFLPSPCSPLILYSDMRHH